MTCATCGRTWWQLRSETPADRCPTCRAGMRPLSTLRGGPKGEKPQAPPPSLEEQA